MKSSPWAVIRRGARVGTRAALGTLPQTGRYALFRRFVDCTLLPDPTFQLKIAETEDELEGCFALLHDAYVASGYMRAHASGLRVTPYHALPTTTTLCAKVQGRVVGTLSIVREGVFGFPLQSAFDISSVRAKEGRIAEISALAVHPEYRKTGGTILFPLMKYMYEYCTRFFDTRHLVIAVHPSRIELYEALLFFTRLTAHGVDNYDFANGAPAVGATLDLKEAPAIYRRAYDRKPHRKNLYRFFVETTLVEQFRFPARPWHFSNDPRMTPAIADHFFNRRTQAWHALDEHRKQLLHSIYRTPAWAAVLPPLETPADRTVGLRRHTRFSMKCPARVQPVGGGTQVEISIVEISAQGFKARAFQALAPGTRYTVAAELGAGLDAQVEAELIRGFTSESGPLFGFHVDRPDKAWTHCVEWLEEH